MWLLARAHEQDPFLYLKRGFAAQLFQSVSFFPLKNAENILTFLRRVFGLLAVGISATFGYRSLDGAECRARQRTSETPHTHTKKAYGVRFLFLQIAPLRLVVFERGEVFFRKVRALSIERCFFPCVRLFYRTRCLRMFGWFIVDACVYVCVIDTRKSV